MPFNFQHFRPGSPAYFEHYHERLSQVAPAGIRLGPFMCIARWGPFRSLATSIAFWLLRLAGWEMVESKKEPNQ